MASNQPVIAVGDEPVLPDPTASTIPQNIDGGNVIIENSNVTFGDGNNIIYPSTSPAPSINYTPSPTLTPNPESPIPISPTPTPTRKMYDTSKLSTIPVLSGTYAVQSTINSYDNVVLVKYTVKITNNYDGGFMISPSLFYLTYANGTVFTTVGQYAGLS